MRSKQFSFSLGFPKKSPKNIAKKSAFTSDYTHLSKENNSNNFANIFTSISDLAKSLKSKKPNTKFKAKRNKKPQQSKNNYKESSTSSIYHGLTRFILDLFRFIFFIISTPVIIIYNTLISFLTKRVGRDAVFLGVVLSLFFVVVFKFAELQVIGNTSGAASSSNSPTLSQVIKSKRGNIYINNYEKNTSNVALTTTIPSFNIYFNPTALREWLELKLSKDITLETIAERISGSLNLPYQKILDQLTSETPPKPAKLKSYVIIAKNVTQETKKATEFLINPPQNQDTTNPENFVWPYANWLGIEPVDLRSYPQGQLLANTLGFVPKYLVSGESLTGEKNWTPCTPVKEANEARGTDLGQYEIGNYGLEQKYCAELSGLNGKKVYNKDKGTTAEKDYRVQNGLNIHLTIDENIQRKAEQVLKTAVEETTTPAGAPSNGSIVVVEASTGKTLALASYPTYDPNDPKILKDEDVPKLINTATNTSYEAGSVFKPLTEAIALNENKLGHTDADGRLLGVNAAWKGGNYGILGKEYPAQNEESRYITNADGYHYDVLGPQSLSNILRDSINTGIADIYDTINSEILRGYLLDHYRFGKKTSISLPGDTRGNLANIEEPANYKCKVCNVNYAFGQGLEISPIQLIRSYTALANRGTIVEPYLIEKMTNDEGNVVDDYTQKDSKLKQFKSESKNILEPSVADDVTGYLVDTTEQGYHGSPATALKVDGYFIAGKTGTSQIGHATKNNPTCNIFDFNGNRDWYSCNTEKGLYDQTFIGYNNDQNGKRYIILVKLSEPKPGTGTKNFAVLNLSKPLREMFNYTLPYLNVPKNK
jgi:cell division protein FtsI/penicillin-binding protein 2